MAGERRYKERDVTISDGELHNNSFFTHDHLHGTELFLRLLTFTDVLKETHCNLWNTKMYCTALRKPLLGSMPRQVTCYVLLF
jgi:hypothetical protein